MILSGRTQKIYIYINILYVFGAHMSPDAKFKTRGPRGAYLRHWSTDNLKYLVITMSLFVDSFTPFPSGHRSRLTIFLRGTSGCKDAQGVRTTAVHHNQILLVRCVVLLLTHIKPSTGWQNTKEMSRKSHY